MSRLQGTAVKLVSACAIAALCWGCARSEDDLRSDIRTRFEADPTLAPLTLSIEVKRRVVYLSGKTSTMDQQQRAVAVARTVAGIEQVVNDMWLNNTMLADKVKEALAHDAIVGKIPIDVEAEGEIVRLSSDQTNSDERERAVKIASAIEGVTRVEDRMR